MQDLCINCTDSTHETVLEHAEYTPPTRQHQLDHTVYFEYKEYLSYQKNLPHDVGIDDLSKLVVVQKSE